MQSTPKPIFYGLLYLDDCQKENPNIRGTDDPLNIYLRCANLCGKSLVHHGYTFRLITNDRQRVLQRLQELGIPPMVVIEEEFTLSVPENVKFRSAHFKLELYRLFGSGRFGDEIGLIDLDCVMVRPIQFPHLRPGTILGYDITDQILPEYGDKRVRSDLEHVGAQQLMECRWFGGEFLFGHPVSFGTLADAISRNWPRYLQYMEQLHHVGDEMLVSASLPVANLEVVDAGQLGLIARWWTARTNFRQMSFDAAATRSILHLPSDKEVLAMLSEGQYCPEKFISRYRAVAQNKLFLRRLYSLVEMLLFRKMKHVARLS